MYVSKIFDDKEMQAWEIKPSADKTWDAAKTHFFTIYKSKEKFNAKHEARSSGFESASSFLTATAMHFSIHQACRPISHPPYQLPTTMHCWSTPTAWKAHRTTNHAIAITLDSTTFLQTLDAQ
jgi:hypothetical protein